MNNFEKFEQVGLKINQERVLTYSKLSCPLECTYCFVDEMSQEQSKKVKYLTEEQFSLLQNLPEQVKLIMLGCDTEFFQNKVESQEILRRLITIGKDISVITKLSLSEDYIKFLGEINSKIVENGNIFSFSISVPCLSDAIMEKYEPRVPHPNKRIQTLRSVFNKGIPTTVAVRPLLPDVSDRELEDIISNTKDYCFGYYSGPLYLKEDKVKNLLPEYLIDGNGEHQPPWMLDGNTYQSIEKHGQMDYFRMLVEKNGKMFFEGVADAIEYLRNKKTNEKSGN